MKEDLSVQPVKELITDVMGEFTYIQAMEKEIELKNEELAKQASEIEQIRKEKQNTIIDLETQLENLQDEKEKLKTELENIHSELSSITAEFKSLSEEKSKITDTREALKFLVILLRDVFGGQSHGIVLRLLHDQESKSLNRETIAKTTGLGGAIIRKVASDLHQAGIVTYDIETGEVTLVKNLLL